MAEKLLVSTFDLLLSVCQVYSVGVIIGCCAIKSLKISRVMVAI